MGVRTRLRGCGVDDMSSSESVYARWCIVVLLFGSWRKARIYLKWKWKWRVTSDGEEAIMASRAPMLNATTTRCR